MKFKKYIVLFLLLCEFLSLFLTYKSFSNKEINEIKETYEVKNKTFSMFIENEEGNYTEYNESNLFPEGYKINLDKSKCVDTKGNVINGILSGSGTNVTVKSTTTSYCYLYFDIGKTDTEKLIENVSSDVLWASTLEDDGYRFVGTDPANYVCFGYSNFSTDCDFTNATNSDLYAYRIIGIFEDETRTKHLKLIKKEALNETYMWNSDYETDIGWDESDLYNGINGSYFLTNTTYSYMQDTNWTNKIIDWDYTATNTRTYDDSGPYYYYMTTKAVYLHEMNRSTKTSETCKTYYYDSDLEIDEIINTSCVHGEWTTIRTKVGLMYVSDYLLSLGSASLEYKSETNSSSLKTGWIHLSNNDSDALSTNEWTMTRMGISGDISSAWTVYSTGDTDVGSRIDDTYSARPVFYLTTDVTISGDGTIESPYIIS